MSEWISITRTVVQMSRREHIDRYRALRRTRGRYYTRLGCLPALGGSRRDGRSFRWRRRRGANRVAASIDAGRGLENSRFIQDAHHRLGIAIPKRSRNRPRCRTTLQTRGGNDRRNRRSHALARRQRTQRRPLSTVGRAIRKSQHVVVFDELDLIFARVQQFECDGDRSRVTFG